MSIALKVVALALVTSVACGAPVQDTDGTEPDMALRQIEGTLRLEGIQTDEDSLIAALSHEDPFVRQYAAVLLGMRQTEKAAPALRKLLTDESERVRVDAAVALAHLDDDSGMDILLGAIEPDRHANLRYHAAIALTQFDNPAGYPVILEILASPSKADRLTGLGALQSYAELDNKKFDGKRVDIVLAVEKVALSDTDAIVRMQAVMLLASLQRPSTCHIFEKAASDIDSRVRNQAEYGLQSAGCSTVEEQER